MLPGEFGRFEFHLGEPVKIHNIRKRMQRDAAAGCGDVAALIAGVRALPGGRQVAPDPDTGADADPIDIYARGQHKFAEGPDLLLSDAVLYAHLHNLLRLRPGLERHLPGLLPRTWLWVGRMREAGADRVMGELSSDAVGDDAVVPDDGASLEVALGVCRRESLYACDPKRKNPGSCLPTSNFFFVRCWPLPVWL